jgi:hypothetical protein
MTGGRGGAARARATARSPHCGGGAGARRLCMRRVPDVYVAHPDATLAAIMPRRGSMVSSLCSFYSGGRQRSNDNQLRPWGKMSAACHLAHGGARRRPGRGRPASPAFRRRGCAMITVDRPAGSRDFAVARQQSQQPARHHHDHHHRAAPHTHCLTHTAVSHTPLPTTSANRQVPTAAAGCEPPRRPCSGRGGPPAGGSEAAPAPQLAMRHAGGGVHQPAARLSRRVDRWRSMSCSQGRQRRPLAGCRSMQAADAGGPPPLHSCAGSTPSSLVGLQGWAMMPTLTAQKTQATPGHEPGYGEHEQ